MSSLGTQLRKKLTPPPRGMLSDIDVQPLRMSARPVTSRPHLRARLLGLVHSRPFLWSALFVLLVLAESLLIMFAFHYRLARTQELTNAAAASAASEFAKLLSRDLQTLVALPERREDRANWVQAADALLVRRAELRRVESWLPNMVLADVVESRLASSLRAAQRSSERVDAKLACAAALQRGGPSFSASYYVAQPVNLEVMDLCVAQTRDGAVTGFLVATFSLASLLESVNALPGLSAYSLTLQDSDGSRLAHAGAAPGGRDFLASRVVELPGAALTLTTDNASTKPSWYPDALTSLVIGLSLMLAAVVCLLANDVRRRSRAEAGLSEALAFRKAIEDSVVTGLRARGEDGLTSYVNPAFCRMVGREAEELIGKNADEFWPEERRAGNSTEPLEARFMRKTGETFPVMVFEAPLVDGSGRHSGRMTAVLDMSAQRKVEDLARQQQERMQVTARLATMGEMASLLSHELNQPLSAIASFATASLNMIRQRDGGDISDKELWAVVEQSSKTIAEQAERAGSVIKSVQDFVRRRERDHEVVGPDVVVEAVLPLVRLQARKSGARVVINIPEHLPKIVCDRSMVEQVVLNLARNGLQAMQADEKSGEPRLEISAALAHPSWVRISVTDSGPGVSAEVAQKLFTPFFTTRSDGMGLGLSLCRTIVEQHGGALEFANLATAQAPTRGVEFRFTMPVAALRPSGSRRPT